MQLRYALSLPLYRSLSNEHSSLPLSFFPFCCYVQAALWMLFDEYINKVHICIDHPVDRSIFLSFCFCNCISLIPTRAEHGPVSRLIDWTDSVIIEEIDRIVRLVDRISLSRLNNGTRVIPIRFRSINSSSLIIGMMSGSSWRTSGSKNEMRHLVSLEANWLTLDGKMFSITGNDTWPLHIDPTSEYHESPMNFIH